MSAADSLRGLFGEMRADMRRMAEKQDELCERTEKIERHVGGDPADPSKPGMHVRVRLLEESESRRKWWTNTAIGAAVVAVAAAVKTIATGK